MKAPRFSFARSSAVALAALLATTGVASTVHAQAYNYPSMQLPQVSNRDYTAALSVAKGTVALFQWREGINEDWHFSLDAGLGDPEGRNNDLIALAAGGFGAQLLRANGDQPLDLLLTGQLGLAMGAGQTIARLPVGVSMGHRFPLDARTAITPYVHPRLSIDRCFSCNVNNRNSTEVSVNFDVGVNFEVSPRFAVRAAGSFSGSDIVPRNDAFAIGFNWTPAPLSRK